MKENSKYLTSPMCEPGNVIVNVSAIAAGAHDCAHMARAAPVAITTPVVLPCKALHSLAGIGPSVSFSSPCHLCLAVTTSRRRHFTELQTPFGTSPEVLQVFSGVPRWLPGVNFNCDMLQPGATPLPSA